MRRAWLIVILLAALTASAAVAVELPKGMMALTARPAPPLRLADMDGRVTDLSTLRGRWVLVHFWASWCGPCRREMPTLASMYARTGLTTVLVNTAESDEEVFAFMSVAAPNMESLMDRDGLVTEAWQPRGLPASFLVDPAGQLRYLALGGRDWESAAYLAFLAAVSRGGAAPAAAAENPR